MITVSVGLPGRRYDVLIGEGLLRELGGLIKPRCEPGVPVAVVTDENVWRLYREPFETALKDAGVECRIIVLPPGEQTKSISGLEMLYGAFADMKLKRGGLAVAFGGGVIGDLCGFAAATYMRGIRYIQIPTTLLSQVDSSVGGKTAINLEQGKNMAGAFYQPVLVAADTGVLRTLTGRDYRGGMAEVIKYGAIRSRELFDRLARSPDEWVTEDIIAECCRIKSGIVENDELDTGERMLLNFGHTIGHGVEKLGRYETYSHGEAVAVGMVAAALIGEEMGLTASGCARELKSVLEAHGLDTACPFSSELLMPVLELDKKSGGDGVKLILLREIGEAFAQKTSFAELAAVLERVDDK